MEFLKSGLKLNRLKKGKGLKKDQLLILLLAGILLIVIAIPVSPEEGKPEKGNTQEREGSAEEPEEEDGESYERRQERRLKEALEQVEGVGKAEVMITLKAGTEKVIEKDTPSSAKTSEERDAQGGTRITEEETWTESTVYSEDNGERLPYVVKELEPSVQGVLVIAQGGGNAAVKQNILEAVQALFPIEAHKIKIMKMEGAK